MIIRVPFLLLWNLVHNVLRAPFVLLGWLFGGWRKPKPKYLRFTIKKQLVRWEQPSWLQFWKDEPSDLTLQEWKELLEKLGPHKGVKGLVLEIKQLNASMPLIEELRGMLDGFRAQDKRVVLLVHNHLGVGDLMLSTAADQLLVQPSASVFLSAPSLQSLFFGDVLKRVGVEMAMERIGNHKNAPESMTRPFPSPTNRDDLNQLLGALGEQLFPPLAASRGMEVRELFAHLAVGVFELEEALARGLIDGIRYSHRMEEYLHAEQPEPFEYPEHPLAPPKEEEGEKDEDGEEKSKKKKKDEKDAKPPLVEGEEFSVEGLRWWVWTPLRKKPKVAVIPVSGAIVDQASRTSSGEMAVRDPIVSAIESALEDRRVKAAVVAVNSRGGSGTASEAIWWALRQLDAKKPVVAYLDDYAASGGYYVACGARKIISSPWCITGSIGVFGGKPVLRDLLQRLSVGVATVGETPGSRFLSPLNPPTPQERKRLKQQLALFYDRFVLRVADNRKRPFDDIEPLARGRVYLASQAKEVGLVDGLGGLLDAVEEARQLAQVKDAELQVFRTSSRLSMLERLTGAGLEAQIRAPYSPWEAFFQLLPPTLDAGLFREAMVLLELLSHGDVAAWYEGHLAL